MIRFLESDKKNRSRLPNDNFVAVQFDDDAVFDAVTHRKNANSRTGPGYGLGLATLTDAPTRQELGTRTTHVTTGFPWTQKKPTPKRLDNCAQAVPEAMTEERLRLAVQQLS